MAEQIFQIGVKALVRNAEGAILIVGHRSTHGARLHVDLPGGRMEAGETFADTLRRELQEELSITVFEQKELVGVVQANISITVGETQVPLVLVVYAIELPPATHLHPGGGEELFDWVAPQRAAELLAAKYPPSFTSLLTTDL